MGDVGGEINPSVYESTLLYLFLEGSVYPLRLEQDKVSDMYTLIDS